MPDKDRFFTAMLALIVVLLGALGTMSLVSNNQLWSKLDRMTALFLHEKDYLVSRVDKVDEKVNCLRADHLRDMQGIEEKRNGDRRVK